MLHVDLFSGIGGFALAARRFGWRTVLFCEIDRFCQGVLAKNYPGVPVYDDVFKLTGKEIFETINAIRGKEMIHEGSDGTADVVVSAGFP